MTVKQMTMRKSNKKQPVEIFEPKKSENIDISLAQGARKELAEELGLLLADTYTLYLKTQNFHWNVKGARFISLHELFEKQYLELFAALDVIAERIRALGYLAPATFTEFLRLTTIEEGDSRLPASEMIRKLMVDHEKISQSIRVFAEKAEKAKDQATTDLFSERSAAHEKAAWMLRSLLDE